MTAPARTIAITAVDPVGPTVMCTHADGVTKYTSQNGWQFTQLPRRQSMTEFMGYDGYTLVVPCMFGDGYTRTSVEPQLEVLRGLARNMVGPRVEPAVLSITCPIIPLTQLKYIINDFAFNKEFRNNDGSRYYVQVDITFFEWQPTSLVLTKTGKTATQLLAAATAANGSANPPVSLMPVLTPAGITLGPPAGTTPITPASSSSVYIVRAGDTLETIAKAVLGSATQWKAIGDMQNPRITDPKSIHVGEKLRLPAGAKNIIESYAPTLGGVVGGKS